MLDSSASDSENFFDDNDNTSIVADSLGAGSTPSDIESPQPRKRRRLTDDRTTKPHRGRSKRDQNSTNSDDESGIVGSDFNTSDADGSLPSPRRDSAEGDGEREAISRYKIFVPKRKNAQENVFVTQLTQPPSSPERIRGPRWKKPDLQQLHRPDAASRTPEIVCHPGQGGSAYDEDDLRAAIAASLDSLEVESSRPASALGMSALQAPVPAGLSGPEEDASAIPFDFDDIPEDAFDSSPALTPPPRPANPPGPSMSQPSQGSNNAIRATSRQSAFRQITLFDMGARNPSSARHADDVDCCPPDREEPPTHHKLNSDATDTWVYPTNLGKTRDYQFNITQKGLFHNLLVALPTGLGKTFIAATIMLNWYRWTKDAQIVFVAPTKPLVAQQISACFGIAGIPRSQTTMLTGGAAPGIRAEEWQAKRVFFMTPQTLINDLKTGIADPKRIVLLVVDEAHRATGGYAYVEVVKFLRRFSKSFRVLALTATPGSTVESVQAVIDGLDISRVEIRTEQSLDIREYVHSRNIEIETFENSDEMVECMDQFSSTLQPLVDQLRTLNAFWGRDPMALTAYGLTKARQQWAMSDAGRNAHFGLKNKVNAIFTVLASLAHAIDLLKYHGITPFYRHLLHFQAGKGDGKKGGKYQRQIVEDDNYKKMMGRLQVWTKHPEFIGHPKLEYLKQVVLNHFMDRGEGTSAENGSSKSKTRIMIFVHFRDSAEEVVRVLKRYEPMIRPHVFIGQSSAKGSEGMDQKTQLKIVEKFKEGTYNTIVATSIGEEGLDIGEVDLIVCYDSSASPIRMLQRMGRTGRKRAGNIVLLLMKGKEEDSYTKAKDNYEKMQQMIASGSRFTFHDDRSPRILPRGIKPVADKRSIDIPPENSQHELPEPRRPGRAPKRPPKKFHMPDDVETGFRKASNFSGTDPRKRAEDRHVELRPVRLPTPEPAEVPDLEDVLLTPAQQRELGTRYQNVSGTTPQFIRHPRNDAFPSLQSVSRPTRFVKHGSLTRRMIDTLQRMGKTDANCEDRYQEVLAAEPRSPNASASRARSDESVLGDPPLTSGSNFTRPESVMSDFSTLDERRPLDPTDLDDSPLVSPAKLSAMCLGRQDGHPPAKSQASGIDDTDLDLDLPDLETLLGSRVVQPPANKKRRAVIEDDSDE